MFTASGRNQTLTLQQSWWICLIGTCQPQPAMPPVLVCSSTLNKVNVASLQWHNYFIVSLIFKKLPVDSLIFRVHQWVGDRQSVSSDWRMHRKVRKIVKGKWWEMRDVRLQLYLNLQGKKKWTNIWLQVWVKGFYQHCDGLLLGKCKFCEVVLWLFLCALYTPVDIVFMWASWHCGFPLWD